MTSWIDTKDNFDSIEWSLIDWLRADWPTYLAFHEANCGHLPENFDFAGISSPEENDGRYRAMRRIAYLSYSVFVNIATARRAVEMMPSSFTDLLEVYDHVSRIALRLGAAIDIAKLLERECKGVYDGRGGVHVRKETPLHEALKKTLDDDDAYNNYLKHTGLPPVRIETVSGIDVVFVPTKLRREALDATNISPWLVSKPDAPVKVQAEEALARAVTEFRGLFDALRKETPARLSDWKVTRKADPRGVRLLINQDGYVSSGIRVPGSGSFWV